MFCRFQLPTSSPQHSIQSAAGTTIAYSSPEPGSPRGSPRASESQIAGQKSWVRRVQARTDELRRLFGLDPTEQLMDDFMCALRKKVLLQGRLFVFERHFCFYSSLFGYHKAKVIPLEAVADISKKKNVGFPNSIQVMWNSGSGGVKKEFYTSFLSREDAYRLMLGLWARCSDLGKERAAAELGPTTDTDGEIGTAMTARGISKRWSKWSKGNNGALSSSMPGGASGNDHMSDRISVVSAEDDPSRTLADGSIADEGPGDAFNWLERPLSAPPPDSQNVLSDNEDTVDLVHRASFIPGSKSVREFEDGPTGDDASIVAEFKTAVESAPAPPENMQKVLSCTLPTTPLGFYRAFLCPSSDFFVAFHESQGHHTIQISPWQRHYKVGPVRDLRFVTPLKGWRIGPPQALCHQTQRFKVYSGQHLVFETSQVMSDIPYGDHFRVDQRWDVTPGPDPGICTLQVHIVVPFTKNTLWKRVIEKSVTDSTLEAFNMFKELADRQLQEIKELETDDGAVGGTVSAAGGGEAPGGSAGAAGAQEPITSPIHRRVPSRPTTPEEALPTTNEEWAALLASVEPQWRSGLRSLRRMQLNTQTNVASPLPGGSRHKRRGSRSSRGGSIGVDFQSYHHSNPFGTVSSPHAGGGDIFPSSPTVHSHTSPALPRVPESRAVLGEDSLESEGVWKKVKGFLSARGPILMLCLLCFVIICMQVALFTVQVRKTTPLAESLDGEGGPARLTMAREVSSVAAEIESLQREVQAWAAEVEAAVGISSRLAHRVKRLQEILEV